MSNVSTPRAAFAAGALWAALLVAVPAGAADLAASGARQIGDQLTSAFITADGLARDVKGQAGKKASADVRRGVANVDEAMTKAQRLANDHPGLAPGLGHVRTNMAGVVADGKVSDRAAALVDESIAELHALIVNAHIVEAVGNLRQAATALEKKDSAEVTFYLKGAEAALTSASQRGAYHIENDIEEIQASLRDISAKVEAHLVVSRDAIDQRIAEVQAHMFDLSQEK